MNDLKLAENILGDVEKIPTRFGYGDALLELGRINPDVVVLGADLSSSLRVDQFAREFPQRFVQIGIAEQDMMGVAAGLSLTGKIPYVSTYGVFCTGRAWDQLRTTVAYARLNVKIGSGHGGISVGADGATHQALEDIAITRTIPNLTIIVPCDYHETKKATLAASQIKGPVIIRFGREKVPVITTQDTPFEVGKASIYRQGVDVTIAACGVMVYESLIAAEKLALEGISAKVINCHTVKPLDMETLVEAARETGAMVTAEEHQVMGGFGSAVAEVLSQALPVPLKMVGIQDTFGQSG
ncbi:MAG TPA: transketolase C-terminal domain-containing protein, partial [Synergistales bacterium]|nr:transketolase C-terminal domain-containing protein [Synergistales bacterium]